tara:strand:+ start:231 stop:599 length:369 start_codon:yes stop_codon:yes gene_type:complete
MTHNELAQRIETAEGPDRALDAEIAAAVGWRVLYDKSDPNDAEPYYQPVPEMSWQTVPRYTGSLDAAMQLVPAGHNWAIDTGHKNGISAWCFDGHLWNTDASVAATPALALCAAAIRARSAS